MFDEILARLERDHLRTHLRAYLDEVNARYPRADRVELPMPKSFEVSTLVGGVAGVSRETLPALAVDAYSDNLTPENLDLWTYRYQGAITGLVTGADAVEVEKRCRRYLAAVELYVRDHWHPPMPSITPAIQTWFAGTSWPFKILSLERGVGDRMGAANVPDQKHGESEGIWIDGFRLSLFWNVSEDGPRQHGT